jgi:hypothetical protein
MLKLGNIDRALIVATGVIALAALTAVFAQTAYIVAR